MNVELHADTSARAPFVVRRDDVLAPSDRPVCDAAVTSDGRTTEGAALSFPASEPASRPVLPWWLWRVLVAWGALTLASLVGPCRPLSPSPALAAEASP